MSEEILSRFSRQVAPAIKAYTGSPSRYGAVAHLVPTETVTGKRRTIRAYRVLCNPRPRLSTERYEPADTAPLCRHCQKRAEQLLRREEE